METAEARSSDAAVACVGLSCLDMMLLHADRPRTCEAITAFDGTQQVAGGSCCNVARTVAATKVRSVAVTLLGTDPHGHELFRQLKAVGVDVSEIVTDKEVNTSLAVLPVFKFGGRGCYVDLGANKLATPEWLLGGPDLPLLRRLRDHHKVSVFHFGYPHLMEKLQGNNLARMLRAAREHSLLVSLDINGADRKESGILQQGLEECFFVHANLEEAAVLSGKDLTEETATVEDVEELGEFFLGAGVGVVTISLGFHGAYVASQPDPERLRNVCNGRVVLPGVRIFRSAVQIEGHVNTTGAGDAFVAGALSYVAKQCAISQKCQINPERMLDYALITAGLQVDSEKEIRPFEELSELISIATPLPSRFHHSHAKCIN